MQKKITTNITYRVPAWAWCNQASNKKNTCRFCVKEKGFHRCALYDEVLQQQEDVLLKTEACKRATSGFKSIVEDVPDPIIVDPKELIKMSVEDYIKTRKQLISQGYPSNMVDKIAKQMVLGGK